MSIPTIVLARINARLATVWGLLRTRQEAFFGSRGRYWQGPRTHTTRPSGDVGEDSVGDRLDVHILRNGGRISEPSWAQAFPELNALPIELSLKVHAYGIGPRQAQQGFSLIAEVKRDGRVWRRVQAHGWEADDRTHGWTRLEDD